MTFKSMMKKFVLAFLILNSKFSFADPIKPTFLEEKLDIKKFKKELDDKHTSKIKKSLFLVKREPELDQFKYKAVMLRIAKDRQGNSFKYMKMITYLDCDENKTYTYLSFYDENGITHGIGSSNGDLPEDSPLRKQVCINE